MMPALILVLKPECHKEKVRTLGRCPFSPVPPQPFPHCKSTVAVVTYNVPQGMHLPLRTISIRQKFLGAPD